MTRLLSALVLLPLVIGTVWMLPPWGTLVLAEVVVALAVVEYARLAEQHGARVSRLLAVVGSMATAAAVAWPRANALAVLATAVIVAGAATVAAGRPPREAFLDSAASVFPLLYFGIPAGAVAAVRAEAGARATLVLLFTVMASDTAQFYGGRLFGRRPLAPLVSPKKTVEGAAAGFLAGTAVLVGLAPWGLPGHGIVTLAVLGIVLVGLGIVGDLFESMLKRGAGVKDASHLIPGHGGMMDRIDALVFAAPVYYLYLRYGVA
jgi:phosphatidate cytidylyltransferase